MALVNAAKIVTGTCYSFSFLERWTVEGGKSHLVTSTETPLLLEPRCVAALSLLQSTEGSKVPEQKTGQ